MFTLKFELETLFIFMIAMVTSAVIFVSHNNRDQRIISPVLPAAVTTNAKTQVISPLIQVSSLDSPDGGKKLILRSQTNKNLISYSLYALDNPTQTEKLIFTKEVDRSFVLSLPFNSFSPDDSYVFIKETTGSKNNYYALSTTTLNTQPANISDLFSQKYPNYTLSAVTGWASPTLLILNTNTDQNVMLSLWFDLTSQGFIPLATRFN